MVIVDTSAWVEFFRRTGDPGVKLAMMGLLDAFECALCGPVEMEFLGGARPQELQKIRDRFDVLPYVRNNPKLWREAAANYSKLRVSGATVPWNDVLIATIALANSLRVYAPDKHFPVMAETLGLRLYSPGYNGIYNPDP